MMNKQIFAVTIIAVLMHQAPALAMASEPATVNNSHPISSLIGDWGDFHTNILAKTKQYDKYSDITKQQLTALPTTLVGHWQSQSRSGKPGNRLQTELTLKPNKTFTYRFVALAGKSRQQWQFSGKWEEKSGILMLLIEQSTYPGEQKDDVLFWRLLHVDQHKLVYIRSGAGEMMAMTRGVGRVGS